MLSPLLGLVYHIKGCIQFGDCSSFHYYEFTRQSGQLSATEQDQGGTGEELVPSVMVFTGIGLKEDALRSWVQGCQHEVRKFFCQNHSLLWYSAITKIGNKNDASEDKIGPNS